MRNQRKEITLGSHSILWNYLVNRPETTLTKLIFIREVICSCCYARKTKHWQFVILLSSISVFMFISINCCYIRSNLKKELFQTPSHAGFIPIPSCFLREKGEKLNLLKVQEYHFLATI